MSMTPEERASLIQELRGIVENREKMSTDVRSILSEEIPKAVAKALGERQPGPFTTIGSERYLESSLPSPSREGGSDYALGTPPAQSVLRAIKQPLFDTLIVPEEGIASEREITLFDRKYFPNGQPKLRRHTNMIQEGCLGIPLEYDFSGLELRFEKWSHADDVRAVLRGLHLQWYFGQNVPWLRVPASGFKPLIVLPHEIESWENEVRQQIERYAETGVWPAWTHDMRGNDRKPRRITGPESFRCGVECAVSELHGPVTMKVLMQDTLYSVL
jgi:hypothetical protein